MSLRDQAHPNPHRLEHLNGTTPQMVGRYPDYDVLTQVDHWDALTRRVVLDRVERVPPIRFFTPDEAQTLKAFCDIATAQDEEPRIPILSYIDEKLEGGVGDGWQYDDLPVDGEVWRIVARALDEEAGGRYADASEDVRVEIVHRFSKAELQGGVWGELNVERAWGVVMRYVVQAFYSHPWAWNEIGFGGPAYPRGYMRLQPGPDGREPYEAIEAFDVDPVDDLGE